MCSLGVTDGRVPPAREAPPGAVATRRSTAKPPARHPWLKFPTGAVAVETAAFAVLVAVGGSPGWRAVRVVIVLAAGALAIVAARGTRPVITGVTSGVAGLVGLTTGAGIGVMHVVKSDVDLSAVSALAVLAAGLALLAAGVSRLWRATPKWWRLAGIPLAVVVVEFAVIPLTVATYGTNLPASPLGKTTPADKGLAYENVTFTTTDHVRLSGWYIPARNGAAVAVLHGSGSTRTAVLDQAAVLARHGYGVLLFDARGHGRSGGVGMDFGWWGDRDLDAAVTWLAGRPEVTGGRIAAVGMSMGGEEAIGAAATDTRIRAVVTEGALWRGSQDAGWLRTDVDGVAHRGMLAVQDAVTGLLTSAPKPISLHHAVQAIAPRPVLLIAGKPELRGDRYLRDAAPASVELWELPDTPHISGLSSHPAEWEARVIDFLDRALPGANG